MKTAIAVLAVCTTLVGCLPDRIAPDGNAGKFYQPYVGAQTNWPTAPSAYVSQQSGLTVYHGLPAQPYIILGRFDRPNIPLFRVARVAHQQKADAILLAEESFIEHRIQAGFVTTKREQVKQDATAYLIKFTE